MVPPTELPADPLAGAGVLTPETETELAEFEVSEGPLVAIVMGAESDQVVMQDAVDELTERGISFETTVVSAHRDPDQVREYARAARQRGIKVVIAGAGLAAALPGAIASHTDLPVIGVPIRSENAVSGGLDALLSIAQSPTGVPVACVAINGARNAAILAARILFA
jgi:phosphoribosylaminoimidazole carboxylase PurE protein